MATATNLGQARTIVGLCATTYNLDIDNFVDSGAGVDTAKDIKWDFGTGDIKYGPTVSFAWPSPGVYELKVTFYETGFARARQFVRLVRMGYDTAWLAGGHDDPYADAPQWAACGVMKIREPGGAVRLGFMFSDIMGGETGGDGGTPFEDDVTHYYNLTSNFERLYASSVLRFPLPDPDVLEEGLYGIFRHDVLYMGTSDSNQEQTRLLKEYMLWDYTSPGDEACPYRIFEQIAAMGDTGQNMEILHPHRPFTVILPEGRGLRLAMTEKETDFELRDMSNLTVEEYKDVMSPRDKEERESQEYSLAWMRGVIWDLANMTKRFANDINIQELEAGNTRYYVLAVLNCDDMSFSLRLFSDNDDPYDGWQFWRHLTTQLRLTPDPESVERITSCRMYQDKTGDPVKVLLHNHAEELAGQNLPLDQKVVGTGAGYFLLDPRRKILQPLGGGGTRGGLHAALTTRAGGAMFRAQPDGESVFLGSMRTVDGWVAPPKQTRERWKGLLEAPATTELMVEGVIPSYATSSMVGLTGGKVEVYNVDEATSEMVCNIELGPKDFGEYETVDAGVVPFAPETRGGVKVAAKPGFQRGMTRGMITPAGDPGDMRIAPKLGQGLGLGSRLEPQGK